MNQAGCIHILDLAPFGERGEWRTERPKKRNISREEKKSG